MSRPKPGSKSRKGYPRVAIALVYTTNKGYDVSSVLTDFIFVFSKRAGWRLYKWV